MSSHRTVAGSDRPLFAALGVSRRGLLLSLLLLVNLLFHISPSRGQTGILSADEAFRLSAERGTPGTIILHWKIAPGHYLYRTHMTAREMTYDAVLPLNLPPGVQRSDRNFGTSEIYRDEVTIIIVSAERKALMIGYQGCKENSICYPPNAKRVDLTSLSISDESVVAAAAVAVHDTSASSYRLSADPSVGLVQATLARGRPLGLVASFFRFGILFAFSLCVLPMYPILAATMARSNPDLSLTKGIRLSFAYVISMALSVGLLGIVAALSGRNLQVALQSPVVVGAAALLFASQALLMFGPFNLDLPRGWVDRIDRIQKKYASATGSAALLGCAYTLIVGPCLTAPLAGSLLYITQTGNTALGTTSLLALGFGQGIPLIAFGALCAGVLARASRWRGHIKSAFGFVFTALAVWMLGRILTDAVAAPAGAVALALCGVLIGGFHELETASRRLILRVTGIALILGGVLVGAVAIGEPFDIIRQLSNKIGGGEAYDKVAAFSIISSRPELDDELHEAFVEGKPALVYVTADWCLICKNVDRKFLSASSARRLANDLHLVKLDLTHPDQRSEMLMRDLKVVGPPTLIFFNPSSNEVPGSRLIGQFSMESFLASTRMAIR